VGYFCPEIGAVLTEKQINTVSDIMMISMGMVEKTPACAPDYLRDLVYLHGQHVQIESYVRECLEVRDGMPCDVYSLLEQQCTLIHGLWRDKQRQLFQCLSTDDRAAFLADVGIANDYDDNQLHVMDNFALRLALVLTNYSGNMTYNNELLTDRYVFSSSDPTVNAFMQPLINLMTAYISHRDMSFFIKKSREYLTHAKPSRMNQALIGLYQAVVTLLRLCFYSLDLGLAWVLGRRSTTETSNPLAIKWVGRDHFFPREVESVRQLTLLNQLQTTVSSELSQMITDNSPYPIARTTVN
jgi:hypothetical protein